MRTTVVVVSRNRRKSKKLRKISSQDREKRTDFSVCIVVASPGVIILAFVGKKAVPSDSERKRGTKRISRRAGERLTLFFIILYVVCVQTLRRSDWSNFRADSLRSGSIFVLFTSLMSLFNAATNCSSIICGEPTV